MSCAGIDVKYEAVGEGMHRRSWEKLFLMAIFYTPLTNLPWLLLMLDGETCKESVPDVSLRKTWGSDNFYRNRNLIHCFETEGVDYQGKEFLKKTRCCLRGGCQQPYIENIPDAIHAPVASHESIRLPLAVTADESETLLEAFTANWIFQYSCNSLLIQLNYPQNQVLFAN